MKRLPEEGKNEEIKRERGGGKGSNHSLVLFVVRDAEYAERERAEDEKRRDEKAKSEERGDEEGDGRR